MGRKKSEKGRRNRHPEKRRTNWSQGIAPVDLDWDQGAIVQTAFAGPDVERLLPESEVRRLVAEVEALAVFPDLEEKTTQGARAPELRPPPAECYEELEPVKQGRKRVRRPNKRQRVFVEGVVEGKTDKQAALDAGYSLSTAENTKAKIWSRPGLQAYFQELIQRAAPPKRLVARLSELIDGCYEKTVVEKRGGHHGDVIVIRKETGVDARVSLRAIELAAQWAGYVPSKGPEIAQQFDLQVQQMNDAEILARLDELGRQERELVALIQSSDVPETDGSDY